MKRLGWLTSFIWVFMLLPTVVNAVDLPLSVNFASYGPRVLAEIQFTIPPEYHAYGHAPGEAGRPTQLDFVLEGAGAMPVLYPQGTESKDIYDPAITTRIYEGRVSLLAILPDHSAGKMFAAELNLLLCSHRHCVPIHENLAGNVAESLPPLSQTPWHDVAVALLGTQGQSTGALSLEEGRMPPLQPSKADDRATEDMRRTQGKPIDDAFNPDFSPRALTETGEVSSLPGALLLGLVAGLLLNAMPCVLPVLTLKVSGLLLLGDGKRRTREFRRHNVCFAAGIMTFFTILALLLGVADLMWGQLYQEEGVILVMLLLVFLLGLSMLGVFSLPMLDIKLGTNHKNPWLNSYLTGVVSTFLATPCSGPLLGGVLAWAFLQPLPILMAVFWSVGAGMSIPYVIFALWPELARFLPRPGAWMQVFERVLGFLLLATALYLFSILPPEKHLRILCVLLLAGFGAWTWGRFLGLSAPRWRRVAAGVVSLGVMVLCAGWIMAPQPPAPQWQPFQAETFLQQLGHKPMLVEFTADWCPNCKFLEATVLDSSLLQEIQGRYDLKLVKVDLTRPDGAAQALLESLGSKSIPFTALFPQGPDARRPVVLRDLYSGADLREAAHLAFAAKNPGPVESLRAGR